MAKPAAGPGVAETVEVAVSDYSEGYLADWRSLGSARLIAKADLRLAWSQAPLTVDPAAACDAFRA